MSAPRRGGGMFRAPARVTFALGGKSNQKRHLNLRFKNPRTLCLVFNLTPYTTRSQDTVVFAAYDESSIPLAPLPLIFSTVETEALFGVMISGSGTGAETIR